MNDQSMEQSNGINKSVVKTFRKKRTISEEDDDVARTGSGEEEEERRLALEGVKLLQKKRERRWGLAATASLSINNNTSSSFNQLSSPTLKNGGGGGEGGTNKSSSEVLAAGGDGGEKDELVLQDTFAQETAITIEDPNMLRYVEQEMAKRRGKKVDEDPAIQVETDLKRIEDQLYAIPDHLKVKKRNSEESSTQWTTGIAEVQLPIEYKLKNIEETEAAKKLLQEKRLSAKMKSELNIPASYSADFFHRGRDYAEKLRRELPELYEQGVKDHDACAKSSDATNVDAGRRQAATDEFMLERFRKRERHRVMRR